MPVATYNKEWRIAHVTSPAGATTTESNRYAWWAWFNALRGRNADNTGDLSWVDQDGAAATAPAALWTVESTCDSVTAGNNDQVNNITAFTDVVFAVNNGVHSWAVLNNAAIGISILSNIGTPLNTSIGVVKTLLDGSIAGFGAANGGADGTTTTAPTATDQAIGTCNDASAFADTAWFIGSMAAPAQHQIHIWASSDGECWRIVIARNSFTVNFTLIEKPADPVTLLGAPNKVWNGAETPWVGFCLGTSGNDATTRAMKYANFSGNVDRLISHCGNYSNTALNTVNGLRMASEAAIQGSVVLARTGQSNLTNVFPLTPITIVETVTAGYLGRWGKLNDIWLSVDTDLGVAEGDNFPGDTTRELVALSFFTLPGDTTQFQMT